MRSGDRRFDAKVRRRVQALAAEEFPRRIWQKDHTLWSDDPTEITDRLGWLTVHHAVDLDELQIFARDCASDGLTTAVLCGMGGSSLAPEVFRDSFGVADGALEIIVLDSTHPDQILAVQHSLDLDRTLFVIASKSGTTTETLSHFEHFWSLTEEGARFVAITDPGTPLEDLAKDRGFRRTWQNQPDIGGRYSALSYFGMVNAALIGADLAGLVRDASSMEARCAAGADPTTHPGLALGAALGEAHNEGRDKLTLVLPEPLRSFGYWVEQLIAESTGKEGKGILPVEGEDLGDPGVYGDDRLFVSYVDPGVTAALEEAGHPVVHVDGEGLGAEMYRWEFATAVAGAVLGIQPFNQPDVQSAKDATKRILESGDIPDPEPGDPAELLASARPGEYLAIQAYVHRDDDSKRRLHDVRMRLRDRLRVATTVGFGPRFLHSTGQLHKGGPNTGLFLQVVDEPKEDVEIPGKPYTFGTLIRAQAAGDLMALRDRDRRVVRVTRRQLESA
ncbi:MAG: glucose-6-phosphate isomerase [Actinomycetota bacterium]